jgi:hypothetical protein
MKKEVFYRWAFALLLQTFPMPEAFCQCDPLARMNFIIVIDGQVIPNGLIKARLYAFVDGQSNSRVMKLEYIPGTLCFDVQDTVNLNGDSLLLELTYYPEQVKNPIKTYQFPFYKTWFDFPFFILRVYNLDNRKYKREFLPEKGKSYTYEYDYPNGYMRRVRRR